MLPLTITSYIHFLHFYWPDKNQFKTKIAKKFHNQKTEKNAKKLRKKNIRRNMKKKYVGRFKVKKQIKQQIIYTNK